MLSPADMLLLGAAALLFFGPDQLPKVARRAGRVMRDVQSTSQSFIREMERAADEAEFREATARMDSVPHVGEPPVPEPPHTHVPEPSLAHGPEPAASEADAALARSAAVVVDAENFGPPRATEPPATAAVPKPGSEV